MKIKSGLLTTNYLYESQQAWPDGAKAQCGGKDIDDIGQICFIEIFIDGMSYIRGEGQSLKDAELAAWNRYQVIINCNHEFKRLGDFSTMGTCIHCNCKKEKVFKRLTVCTVCQKSEVAHNVGSKYLCYTHYMDDLKTNQDSIGAEKYLWINQVAEQLNCYQHKTDEEISETFRYFYHGFFEYLVEVSRMYHEKFKFAVSKHYIDLMEDIEADEVALKAAFELYIVDNKKVITQNNIQDIRDTLENFIKSL